MKVKISNQYAGGILDTNGGFYVRSNKYPFFRMLTKNKKQRKAIRSISSLLEKKEIILKEYALNTGSAYFEVYGKAQVKLLKDYMKRYCLVR